MNSSPFLITRSVVGFMLLLLAICCKPSEKKQPEQPLIFKKPAGMYSDTLFLKTPAAVFFFPDSLQMAAYKAFFPASFKSSEHEYLSQINNARQRLKDGWKQVDVIECRMAKILAVMEEEGSLIDLDETNEPWGLILFEKGKEPLQVDMMNIDTELENYFTR